MRRRSSNGMWALYPSTVANSSGKLTLKLWLVLSLILNPFNPELQPWNKLFGSGINYSTVFAIGMQRGSCTPKHVSIFSWTAYFFLCCPLVPGVMRISRSSLNMLTQHPRTGRLMSRNVNSQICLHNRLGIYSPNANACARPVSLRRRMARANHA